MGVGVQQTSILMLHNIWMTPIEWFFTVINLKVKLRIELHLSLQLIYLYSIWKRDKHLNFVEVNDIKNCRKKIF